MMSCTILKCSISSIAISVIEVTKSSCSELYVIIVMALVAAFCSHQAWSVKISSRLLSAMFAQRGSVNNFSPNIINLNVFQQIYKLIREVSIFQKILRTLPYESTYINHWSGCSRTNFFRSGLEDAAVD